MKKDDASEVLDGTLLSDAGISIPRGSIKGVYQIALSGREHMDWLYYIKDALDALEVKVGSGYPRFFTRIGPTGKPYDYCVLQSRSSLTLACVFLRWYHSGRKEVPEVLRLTPTCLANWFMGDGTSPRGSRGLKVSFATHGFSTPSVELLEHLLGSLGFHVSDTRVGIYLHQDSVDDFMRMVEPHIVPSYRYKVKYKGQEVTNDSTS